jgi:Pentapeptide repeats (8 copies)
MLGAGLYPLVPPYKWELTPRSRRRRSLSAKWVTQPDRTGMICDVSNQEASPEARAAVSPHDPRIHWWSRVSPWWWGLLALVAIAVITATQVPRISALSSAPRSKPSTAPPSATATLSGPAYTQAMVTGRNFVRADLAGAVLEHLDLRGKDFQGADAAGAVFTGSLLDGVNLSGADLRGANLRDACLRGAILTRAELAGADFTGADVTGATVTPATTSTAIGWASIPDSPVCRSS